MPKKRSISDLQLCTVCTKWLWSLLRDILSTHCSLTNPSFNLINQHFLAPVQPSQHLTEGIHYHNPVFDHPSSFYTAYFCLIACFSAGSKAGSTKLNNCNFRQFKSSSNFNNSITSALSSVATRSLPGGWRSLESEEDRQAGWRALFENCLQPGSCNR